MSDLLVIAGIAFLVFFGLSKGAAVASLNFVATGVSFDFSNVLSPIINLTVLVQNPTSGSLSLLSIAGGFTVNGNPSGNVSYFPPVAFAIAPNSQSSLTLTLRLTDTALINNLVNLVNSQGSVTIGVSGTANVGGAPIPINFAVSP